jgi:hypothetical protein
MSDGCLDVTVPFHAATTSKSIAQRHIQDAAVATVMLPPSTRRAPTTTQGSVASCHLMDAHSDFQHLLAPYLKLSLSNHDFVQD